jgi:hypothetical protein
LWVVVIEEMRLGTSMRCHGRWCNSAATSSRFEWFVSCCDAALVCTRDVVCHRDCGGGGAGLAPGLACELSEREACGALRVSLGAADAGGVPLPAAGAARSIARTPPARPPPRAALRIAT